MLFNNVFCLFLILGSVYIYKLNAIPSITKCLHDDDACLKKSAIEVLPLLADGKISPNIKTVDPLLIDKIDASILNLKFVAHGVKVIGLKNCAIENVTRRIMRLGVTVLCTVVVTFEMEMKGEIMTIDVDVNGDVIVSLYNILMNVYSDIAEIEKDSKKFWNVERWEFNYTTERADMKMKKMLRGDADLSKRVQKVFSEQSNEIVKQFGHPIYKGIASACVDIINSFFHMVPVEDLEISN